jgi:hypothetical protein
MRPSNNGKYVQLDGSTGRGSYGYPADNWLLDAKEFTVRVWRSRNGEVLDIRGQARDGTFWRCYGMVGEEITYSGMTEETAKFLDSIIDGVCTLPLK